MRLALLAAGATAALLGGCTRDRVLLLPNEGGAATGAVAVIDEKRNREVVVDQPLTSARLAAGARPHAVKALNESQTELLASLPPRSVGFILNFFTGTTIMRPESRPVLDQIRQEIARRPGAEVQVTGHTDTVGPMDVNDKLSQQRAEAIVKVLIAEGFPAELLSAVGRGERELLVKTPDETSNELNRRVEVIVR